MNTNKEQDSEKFTGMQVVLCIIPFLVPIAGFIIYFIERVKHYRFATWCFWLAIISLALWAVRGYLSMGNFSS